ncbi:UPAR/Ly6 domain-containing protein crok-like [Brevipalpus obovatus]|uniref:UPAR/Ly6 domain-containing protein crok-like n=1 Tax=Brevipalpus obovatus TaxID=246614 RepID=UPI003D9E20EC
MVHSFNFLSLSSKLQCFSLISVLILILFTCTGVSIKCWLCNSRTDPKCADPFVNESIPLNDCVNDPHKPTTPELANRVATMCRKVRQKVDNEWRVIRSCAYLGEVGEGTGNENVCRYTRGSYNIFIETCTCNSKDGCNFANPPNGSNFALIFFSSIISLYIFSTTLSCHQHHSTTIH